MQEIAPDHTVKLDRIGADIPIVRRHGSSFRRLTLIGSDGSQRHFIVQTSLTPNARSDERILQLFRVMNQMFDKHKESRRRHICIHTPIIIPVWSQVISFSLYGSMISFISAFNILIHYMNFDKVIKELLIASRVENCGTCQQVVPSRIISLFLIHLRLVAKANVF